MIFQFYFRKSLKQIKYLTVLRLQDINELELF